ncbi:MAG: response regulator [Alteromonadaceae bacterium]|nr:response regulator [Alteromonadaceae bacterium]
MPLLNIAVIDDDEITLELIVNILESDLQCSVVSFSNSALARQFLLRQTTGSLDLVISDMVMPEYDGLSLLRDCRNSGHMFPFVFMTAYESRQTKLLAKQLGAVAYLVKPIIRKKLISLIKQQVLTV